jgi:hypothetical protein
MKKIRTKNFPNDSWGKHKRTGELDGLLGDGRDPCKDSSCDSDEAEGCLEGASRRCTWNSSVRMVCFIGGKVTYLSIWVASLNSLYAFYREFNNVSNVNASKLSSKWYEKCTTPPFDDTVSIRCDTLMRWSTQGYTVNIFRRVWEEQRDHLTDSVTWLFGITNEWKIFPRLCSDLCWSQLQLLETSLLSDIILAGPIIVMLLSFVCISILRGPIANLLQSALITAKSVSINREIKSVSYRHINS